MKKPMFLLAVIFALPLLCFPAEYSHKLRMHKQPHSAASFVSMSERLEEAAGEYEKHGPVPRIAEIDYSFGKTLGVYRELNAHGVLMIAAQCRDENELPLKKVYVKIGGRETDLVLLLSREYTITGTKSAKVFGNRRVDSFYLIPYAYTRIKCALYADWGKNRDGFIVAEFPDDAEPDFIITKKDMMWSKNFYSDERVLEMFLKQEFSFTSVQAKKAIESVKSSAAKSNVKFKKLKASGTEDS